MSLIYVVDDNPGSRQFTVANLKRGGHEVPETDPTCLFRILEALHNAPPELLISDLMMPACPGQTLIRACREDPHLKDLKILLLTAHGDVQLAHFLQAMGNTHYLAKPVSPAMFTECVDRFLKGDLEIDPGWSLTGQAMVAVVDDSRLSRSYVSSCLRKSGFRPLEIEPTSLLDTVAALEKANPQLLVLDYLMPNFRGDALIRAIRGSGLLADLPVLMVTAHHGEEVSSLPGFMREVVVLHKPVSPEGLIAEVRAMLKA